MDLSVEPKLPPIESVPIEQHVYLDTSNSFYLFSSSKRGQRWRVTVFPKKQYDSTTSDAATLDHLSGDDLPSRDALEAHVSSIVAQMSGKDRCVARSDARAVLGFVRFLKGYYVVLVTDTKRVGRIGPHVIHAVTSTTVIPLFTVKSESLIKRGDDEAKYFEQFKSFEMNGSFFFSYTYDLTNTLQTNMTTQHWQSNSPKVTPTLASYKLGEQGSTGLPLPPRAVHARPKMRCKFVWNEYLLQPLQQRSTPVTSETSIFNVADNAAAQKGLFPLVVFAMRGGVVHSHIHTVAKTLTVTVVARCSHLFAGSRYLKRGVEDNGHVANHVEVEQIVTDQSSLTSCNTKGFFSSFVQVRGSVPVPWYHPQTRKPKPAIRLANTDPYLTATKLHFCELLEDFGAPIYCINLLKRNERKRREAVLSDEYSRVVQCLTAEMPLGKKHIRYIHFDIRNATAHAWNEMTAIAEECVQQTGFYSCSDTAVHLQQGVARVNCIDCIDRTNIAQYFMGLHALGHQLTACGLTRQPVDVAIVPDVQKQLLQLYLRIGDAIAIQYGGSATVSAGLVTRGLGWDSFMNLRRLYVNLYADGEKQQVTNLFLGVYQPSPQEGAGAGTFRLPLFAPPDGLASWFADKKARVDPNRVIDIAELTSDYYLHVKRVPSLGPLPVLQGPWWEAPIERFIARTNLRDAVSQPTQPRARRGTVIGGPGAVPFSRPIAMPRLDATPQAASSVATTTSNSSSPPAMAAAAVTLVAPSQEAASVWLTAGTASTTASELRLSEAMPSSSILLAEGGSSGSAGGGGAAPAAGGQSPPESGAPSGTPPLVAVVPEKIRPSPPPQPLLVHIELLEAFFEARHQVGANNCISLVDSDDDEGSAAPSTVVTLEVQPDDERADLEKYTRYRPSWRPSEARACFPLLQCEDPEKSEAWVRQEISLLHGPAHFWYGGMGPRGWSELKIDHELYPREVAKSLHTESKKKLRQLDFSTTSDNDVYLSCLAMLGDPEHWTAETMRQAMKICEVPAFVILQVRKSNVSIFGLMRMAPSIGIGRYERSGWEELSRFIAIVKAYPSINRAMFDNYVNGLTAGLGEEMIAESDAVLKEDTLETGSTSERLNEYISLLGGFSCISVTTKNVRQAMLNWLEILINPTSGIPHISRLRYVEGEVLTQAKPIPTADLVPDACTAQEIVNWVVEHAAALGLRFQFLSDMNDRRVQARGFVRCLLECGVLHRVHNPTLLFGLFYVPTSSSEFHDDRSLHRFLHCHTRIVLNSTVRCPRMDGHRHPAQIAESLCSVAMQMFDSDARFRADRTGEESAFQPAAFLPGVDLSTLTPESHTSFFVNVFNALFIHMWFFCQRHSAVDYVTALHAYVYDVGGYHLSLSDIKHGILRQNRCAPGHLLPQFGDNDARRSLINPNVDPRAVLALLDLYAAPDGFFDGPRREQSFGFTVVDVREGQVRQRSEVESSDGRPNEEGATEDMPEEGEDDSDDEEPTKTMASPLAPSGPTFLQRLTGQRSRGTEPSHPCKTLRPEAVSEQLNQIEHAFTAPLTAGSPTGMLGGADLTSSGEAPTGRQSPIPGGSAINSPPIPGITSAPTGGNFSLSGASPAAVRRLQSLCGLEEFGASKDEVLKSLARMSSKSRRHPHVKDKQRN